MRAALLFIVFWFNACTHDDARSKPFTYDHCRAGMTWAHQQNSIALAKQAIESGFCGLEVDLHFDSAREVFLLQHDPDSTGSEKFEDLLKTVGSQVPFWWIDFKNLNWAHASIARKRLQDLKKLYAPHSLFLVESSAILPLWRFQSSDDDIQIIFWVQKSHSFPISALENLRVASALLLLNPSFISFPDTTYERLGTWMKRDRFLLAFTSNDAKRIEELVRSGVHIVLTDDLKLQMKASEWKSPPK